MATTVSAIAIVNARRVWRGASVADGRATAAYPSNVNGVLIVNGYVVHVGTSEEVMRRYKVFADTVPTNRASDSCAVPGGRSRPFAVRIIDCQDRYCVYPGFIDSHVHLMDGGRSLLQPDLSFATSRGQLIDIIRPFADRLTDGCRGEWLVGRGWSEAVLGEWPHRDWLDEVSTDVPIVLYSKDVHSCVMNTAALRICHIIPGAADGDDLITSEEGGRIERDSNGQPNGILRDNAMFSARKYTPKTDSRDSKLSAFNAASEYLLSRGFTSAFSMMSTQFEDNISEVKFLQEMEEAGLMHLRVRYAVPAKDMDRLVNEFYSLVLGASQRHDAFTLPFRFTPTPLQQGGGYCILGAVKLFSDGSLSSRTAAMNRPFDYDVTTEGDVDSDGEEMAAFLQIAGSECRCGLLTMLRKDLQAAVLKIHSLNLQCCAHAIGDRAVATVNKALSQSAEVLRAEAKGCSGAIADFRLNPRSRVEHCQHVSNVAKEVKRMEAHSIIASMQPCHLLFDGDYVDELLGSHRKATSYIWNTFLHHNIRVALGSDWPVAPADVNDGLRGAVTRVPDVMASVAAEDAGTLTAAMLRYHSVWNEEECISMEMALRTYTYEGAYAAFLEDFVGTLEEGKFADVTIWSGDFLDESGMQSLGVQGKNSRWWPRGQEPRVVYTIVGGVVEYERHNE